MDVLLRWAWEWPRSWFHFGVQVFTQVCSLERSCSRWAKKQEPGWAILQCWAAGVCFPHLIPAGNSRNVGGDGAARPHPLTTPGVLLRHPLEALGCLAGDPERKGWRSGTSPTAPSQQRGSCCPCPGGVSALPHPRHLQFREGSSGTGWDQQQARPGLARADQGLLPRLCAQERGIRLLPGRRKSRLGFHPSFLHSFQPVLGKGLCRWCLG